MKTTEEINDTGIIQVILQRFEQQRLPRMVEIKENLDQGISLSEFDIEYLSTALHDAKFILPYLERHPEYEPLLAKVFHFYKLITDQALADEKKSL